jgi:hypothetical protein
MVRHTKHINRLNKIFCLFVAATMPVMALAQKLPDRDKFDEIAAKYKDDAAVYTNLSEQLVINVEDGELTASSNITMEKLFISDLSLNTYNTDYFWFSLFHQPTNYKGTAFIPSGKSYKVTEGAFGSGAPGEYVFYDDNRVAQAYYSGLKKNTVTETKYSLMHTDVHMIPFFMFQDSHESLPVVKGEHTSWIKQSKEEKNGRVIYTFTAENIPAPKYFGNVPSGLYYIPHVIPYITSFRMTGAKKDSLLLSNTDNLYKYLYSYIQNINMKQDTSLINKVKEITQNDATAREKAAHIYNWVQKNIHYVGIEYGLEGFIPRLADTVYKRKYGDCKDMTSIIVTMCRKAGLDAYYTWIGTDLLPYFHDETPLNLCENHMIAAIKLGNEWLFLDGTHDELPLGRNRRDIQGKEAFISIDANTYKIVKIPEETSDNNMVVDSTLLTIGDYKINGTARIHYTGHQAWDLRRRIADHGPKDEKDKLIRNLIGRGSNKFIQTNYKISAPENRDRDLSIKVDFTIDDYAQKVGREFFINMNLNKELEDRYIDTKDRTVAYYNRFREKKKEVVVLEIPKGYRVSYMPKEAKGAIDGLGGYKVSYKADGKRIILTKEYEVTARAIDAKKFADNNKMVEDLKKIYKESVVLTAI